MSHSTELWGPDAIEFDPDRWLDERNKTYYLANPFIFVPFLAGPRICLGQQVSPVSSSVRPCLIKIFCFPHQFAYNEISFFLIRFLQKFQRIELAPEAHPEGSLPPSSWKNGKGTRKEYEKVWPKATFTTYSLVSFCLPCLR